MPWRLVLTLYLLDMTWWFSSRKVTRWWYFCCPLPDPSPPPPRKQKCQLIISTKPNSFLPGFLFYIYIYIIQLFWNYLYIISTSHQKRAVATKAIHEVFADLIKSLHRRPSTREWKRGGKGKGFSPQPPRFHALRHLWSSHLSKAQDQNIDYSNSTLMKYFAGYKYITMTNRGFLCTLLLATTISGNVLSQGVKNTFLCDEYSHETRQTVNYSKQDNHQG